MMTSMIVLNFGTARSRVVQGSEEQSGAEIESEREEEKKGGGFSTASLCNEISTSPRGVVVKPVGISKRQPPWSEGAGSSLNFKPGRTL
jgi:hypothetical protein